MNLWTFVLLGFLAHSCSGQIAVNETALIAKCKETLRNTFAKNEGSALAPIAISGNTKATPTCKGYNSLNISVTKRSDGYYSFECHGPVAVTSQKTTGELVLGLNVKATLSLDLVDGVLKFTLVKTAEVTTSVLQTVTGLVGGILQILGGILQTVLGLFTKSCKEGVEEQGKLGLATALNTINADLQILLGSLTAGVSSAAENILTLLPLGFVPVGQNGGSPCTCGTGQGP
ncbi:uncharacterized protein LOC120918793 [Rana temporaria]|uniref:uncharacterized protein LOC120918793 n=1 Tax=Rana temporaria TaxID=8407 RepID=UPI001AAC694A|nr:uncharacterized protein LOC120918793 [Rana temporaria]